MSATVTNVPPQESQTDVITLALDVGGTGIKGCLLNEKGRPISERLRHETPNPATPDAVLVIMDEIVNNLGKFDRVSVGFPGVVKKGATLTAHNLNPKWVGFELQKVLARRWKKPVRVANDAAVQGLAAIEGKGVEVVITLGTGFGSSLYIEGRLVPGLELAHHPWRKDKTYEDFLGRRGLQKYGRKRWNKLVAKAIPQIESLFNYDHMYIGGGNATKIDFDLPKHVTRIPNEDGLLGGVALWKY
ncbi:MAG: ROK family protein [Acidobacteriaceae bacterium]|nr:ROK family protein [Acidobacteriaceae bacterium]MBV9033942.1 ROK family protein [Acidobacteriaceae bacterium]MBV9306089.1 ROK family protein [Acidobacteriaceae bacterium]MBV9676809.1 ROK family protein [Acidobacteriaceae bacterium]